MDFTRRDLASLGTLALAAAPLLGSSALAATTSAVAGGDPYSLVNPELRAPLKAFENFMTAMKNGPGPGGMPKLPVAMPPVKMPDDWVGKKIPGRAGAPDIQIYVHGAKPGTSRPAILHIHGGGFVGGDAKGSLPGLGAIAAAQDCVIVTVEYRLAPATPFPGSLEDNYTALLWLYKNAKDLGVDQKRIAVTGESAGGGHAAMLTIAARDRGEVPIAFQALVYPMLDDRTGSSRHASPNVGRFGWTPEENRKGWSALLGQPAGAHQVPAGSVPARVENLEGLPPAYIGVGSIDLFVDENLAYAQRLIAAGIPVEVNVVPGAFHGFDVIAANTSLARNFVARTAAVLAEALKNPWA